MDPNGDLADFLFVLSSGLVLSFFYRYKADIKPLLSHCQAMIKLVLQADIPLSRSRFQRGLPASSPTDSKAETDKPISCTGVQAML